MKYKKTTDINTAFHKCTRIITSCKTKEQIDNARKIPQLHFKLYRNTSMYDELVRLVDAQAYKIG